MKKLIMIAVACFISSTSFAFAPAQDISAFGTACPKAVSTSDAGFCPSFKSVAQCQCVARGLPAGMCQDMKALYDRMISMFGNIKKACDFQKDTDSQTCIDDWNCFRSGGKDSHGALCSSNGLACA
jgi:hypothetical protein